MPLCTLCNNELETHTAISMLDRKFSEKCKWCGEYEITSAVLNFSPKGRIKEDLHLVSSVARHRNESGQKLQIKRELLTEPGVFESEIAAICPRSVLQKTDSILLYISQKSPHPGAEVVIDTAYDWPLFYCKCKDEMYFYLTHLQDGHLLRWEPNVSSRLGLVLTADGWHKIEHLSRPNLESLQAFVAMSFDDKLKSAYSEGIARLQKDTGFCMVRIDQQHFTEKICDKIISEIRKSRFVIADFTGQRHGVYFEAGYAMGIGLPVICACHKDDLDKCHFDTRQYNHVVWSTPDDLREKLRDRILATIRKSPK